MARRKNPDHSGVIRAIDHHLQYDGPGGIHPHSSHEEAARAMESGDAWRAMIEIGRALDQARRQS